jgi:hypothetical protein
MPARAPGVQKTAQSAGWTLQYDAHRAHKVDDDNGESWG